MLRNTNIEGPMIFGDAMNALFEGSCIAREEMNGDGNHSWIEMGSYDYGKHETMESTEAALHGHGGLPSCFSQRDAISSTKKPCIAMIFDSGEISPNWSPSQDDMLATDWYTVE